MAEPIHPIDVPIATDLPCVKCRYNLRGLTQRDNCPECGAAVGRAANPRRLYYADPRWVRTVKNAFNWIAIGVFIIGGLFLSAVLGGTLYALFRATFMPSADQHELVIVPFIMLWGVMIMMPLLAFFALPVWYFTTPEPDAEGRQLIRKATRVLAVAAGISSLVITPFTLYGPFVVYFVFGGITVTCLWLWAAVTVGVGLRMLAFAWRAPRTKLIAWTGLVVLLIAGAIFGIAIALILALAGVIGNAIGNEEQDQTLADVSYYIAGGMVGVSFFLYLALIGLLVWVILLFRQYQVMFKQVVAQMEGSAASH